MNAIKIILQLIFIQFLFSQFHHVNISYEHNEMTIKDEKVYILESFNDIVKNYYIYNNFSTDYEFLDIPLNIHIIYYGNIFNSFNIY